MNYLKALAAFLLLSFSLSMAVAADAPDSITKSAIDDLGRYEQQAQGLTAARAGNIRRVLKLLDISYDRLQQSPHQDDAVWKQTVVRYDELREQLNNLLNAPANAASSSSAPATNTGQAGNLTSGDSAAATDGGSVPALVSGQRVRVKKLNKDMTAVADGINTFGPSRLQDPSRVEALQKRFSQFSDAIARYAELDDPDVAIALRTFEALQTKLQTEYTRAKEQLTALGDVQGRLVELQTLLAKHPVPEPLAAPFDQAAADEWLTLASNSRTAAEHAHGQLTTIAKVAYLPETRGLPSQGAAFELKDVEQLIGLARQQFQGSQTSYTAMIDTLKNAMSQYESEMATRWQENPEAEDKRWIFLDEQQQAQAKALFEQVAGLGRSYIAIESALKRDTSQGDQLLQKAVQAQQAFDEKREVALATSRMPIPASRDNAMVDIAKTILSNPEYEFGTAGRVVLTTDEIVTRERKDSEVEFDDVDVSASGDIKLSGTETTWTYKWQEFKFAVPLLDESNGNWHIWWITAKNFSSGGARTPIGRWVSGAATKGNQILEPYTR